MEQKVDWRGPEVIIERC